MRDAIAESLLARMRQVSLVAFDFDGVFTCNMVYVREDGVETVRCSRFDGFGLRRLEAAGVLPVIISTETNPVVTARARKLKIRCIQGCDDKVSALQAVMEEEKVDFPAVAFVGNDINDLPCLRRVGLPIVVADAWPATLHAGLYRTQRKGGEGAVREICDLIADAKEKWA